MVEKNHRAFVKTEGSCFGERDILASTVCTSFPMVRLHRKKEDAYQGIVLESFLIFQILVIVTKTLLLIYHSRKTTLLS